MVEHEDDGSSAAFDSVRRSDDFKWFVVFAALATVGTIIFFLLAGGTSKFIHHSGSQQNDALWSPPSRYLLALRPGEFGHEAVATKDYVSFAALKERDNKSKVAFQFVPVSEIRCSSGAKMGCWNVRFITEADCRGFSASLVEYNTNNEIVDEFETKLDFVPAGSIAILEYDPTSGLSATAHASIYQATCGQ